MVFKQPGNLESKGQAGIIFFFFNGDNVLAEDVQKLGQPTLGPAETFVWFVSAVSSPLCMGTTRIDTWPVRRVAQSKLGFHQRVFDSFVDLSLLSIGLNNDRRARITGPRL